MHNWQLKIQEINVHPIFTEDFMFWNYMQALLK